VSAEAVREFAEPIPSGIQQILDRLTTLDTEGVTKFAYNLEQLETLVKAIISDKENLETIYRLNETIAHEDSFKQNSVYNFLRKFELSLERNNTIVTDKL
jgi:predicted transcriptional regulator